jgi:DNA-directed RNA polymerase subunit RPC12/RpoP
MYEGICETCGKPFRSHREQRHCIDHRVFTKLCYNCGAEFESQTISAKYCPSCRSIVNAMRSKSIREGKKHLAKQPELTIGQCVIIDKVHGLRYGEAQAQGLHTIEEYRRVLHEQKEA